MPIHPILRRGERGAALILAMLLISVLLVAGLALLRLTGRDTVAAARTGKKELAQACADAGLQYGRRLFGNSFETTHNWNDYLDDKSPTYRAGYRFDPSLGDAMSLAALPPEVLGKSNGADFDPGADVDGDGQPDFWVSIRDDDDERNLGIPDNRLRDNNEAVVLQAVCIRPGLEWEEGGVLRRATVETIFRHVQGASGYGNAQITSNSPDVVGQN